jgi:hypothetical protein
MVAILPSRGPIWKIDIPVLANVIENEANYTLLLMKSNLFFFESQSTEKFAKIAIAQLHFCVSDMENQYLITLGPLFRSSRSGSQQMYSMKVVEPKYERVNNTVISMFHERKPTCLGLIVFTSTLYCISTRLCCYSSAVSIE